MRFRHAWTVASVAALLALSATSALAQQSLNISAGYFAIRGEGSRVDDDVLVVNRDLFLFDFKDFNSPSLGVEWLLPIGEYLDAGVGVQFTSRSVDTIYDNFVRPDGSEIDQQLKLRNVPLSATIRVLPLGRHAAVQPYVGGGIAVHFWRYVETGDFIDFSQAGRPVFPAEYVDSGTAVGPVAVFGLKVPVGNATIGGEVRYQKAEGTLDQRDFLGSKIDLGGFHYLGTVGFRF